MQGNLGSGVIQTPTRVCYAYGARYTYDATVVLNDNTVRITPYADAHQAMVRHTVATTPRGTQVEFKDRLGNTVHRLRVTEHHKELHMVAVAVMDLVPWSQAVPELALSTARYPADAEEFLGESPLINPPDMLALARDIVGRTEGLVAAVDRTVMWVYQKIEYKKGVTNVTTRAETVAMLRQGVCQDKTHLALGLLRSLNIPCRYISGMLTDQAGDTHAWIEFLHPTLGWLPADPTKGRVAQLGLDYLKLAVGRDYTDVPPVIGSFASSGSGRLDRVYACVLTGRRDLTIDEAMPLVGLDMREAKR